MPSTPSGVMQGELRTVAPDLHALVAEVIDQGVAKNIFHYCDREAVHELARCCPSALLVVQEILSNSASHTSDTPHPLRLISIQGRPASTVAELLGYVSSFAPSEIATDILVMVWHAAFEMGAVGLSAKRPPADLFSDLMQAYRFVQEHFPGRSINPDLVALIPAILRHSQEKIHDLGLLTQEYKQTSSQSDHVANLVEFYCAGHRYLPSLSCLAPRPTRTTKQSQLEDLSMALAKHPIGLPDFERSQFLSLVSSLNTSDIRYVHSMVTNLTSATDKLDYLVDLVHLSRQQGGAVHSFLPHLSKVESSQLNLCLAEACSTIRNRTHAESLLAVLKEKGSSAFVAASLSQRETEPINIATIISKIERDFSTESEDVKTPVSKAALGQALSLYTDILHLSQALAHESTHQLVTQLSSLKIHDPLLTDGKSLALYHSITRLLMQRTKGFLPHHNQMMTVLLLGQDHPNGERGMFAQLATGEGKSVVIAMHVACKAWTGRRVTVVNPTAYLARRDRNGFKDFHSILGLTSDVQDFASQGKGLAAPRILYTTVESIGFGELSRMLSYNSPFDPERLDYCVCDEGDNLLCDLAAHALRIADSFENEGCVDFLVRLMTLVDTIGEDEEALVETLHEFKLSDPFAQSLSDPVFELFCHGALHSKQLEIGKHYVIKNNEIVPVSWRTTGRVQDGIQFGAGLHECLTLRNKLPAPKSVATVAQISVSSLFSRFRNLDLVSGTFGDRERHELCELQNIVGCDIPRQVPRNHRYCGATWTQKDSEWFSMIASSIREVHKVSPDRPIMLVAGSINEAKAVHEFLLRNGIATQLLTDFNNVNKGQRTASEEEIIANAGMPGMVTVATTVAGRGIDISLHPQSKSAGGLHLIVACFSLSERVEVQLFGRVSRQGEPGSSESIIHARNDTFLRSLPIEVTDCIAEWIKHFGPNHPQSTALVKLVRDVVALNEIEQRRVMRQRAETAFSVLTSYLATKANSLSVDTPTQLGEMHYRWLRFSTNLEAALYHPTAAATLNDLVESTQLVHIFQRSFGIDRQSISDQVSSLLSQKLAGAYHALNRMLNPQQQDYSVQLEAPLGVAPSAATLHEALQSFVFNCSVEKGDATLFSYCKRVASPSSVRELDFSDAS